MDNRAITDAITDAEYNDWVLLKYIRNVINSIWKYLLVFWNIISTQKQNRQFKFKITREIN